MNAQRLTAAALQQQMQHRDYRTTQRYIARAEQANAEVENLFVPTIKEKVSAGGVLPSDSGENRLVAFPNFLPHKEYPLGESNPCLRTENPMSWATRRRGLGGWECISSARLP